MRIAIFCFTLISFLSFYPGAAVAALSDCSDEGGSKLSDACQHRPDFEGEEAFKGNDSSGQLTGRSNGIRLKSGAKNIVFSTFYGFGLGRIISNTTFNKDIFVPQKTLEEFAAFFNSVKNNNLLGPNSWAYAVKDLDYTPVAIGYDGCASNVFSAASQKVPPVDVSGHGLARYGDFLKMPPGQENREFTVGSTNPGSAIELRFERKNYNGDCIYDNQGNESCASVVFLQDQSVCFITSKLTTYAFHGDSFSDYTWAEKPNGKNKALYVKINGGAGLAVPNCSADYSSYAPAINGQCGTANGVTVATKPSATPPSTTLCAKGNASVVSGSGPWNWTCNSVPFGAGTSASCSAGASVCPTGTAVNWSNGSYNCTSNTTSVTSSGSTTSVTATGTNKGNATFLCTSGALTVQPGATCQNPAACPVGTSGTWTVFTPYVGTYTCSGTTTAPAYAGATTTVSSTNVYEGSGIFVCESAGTLTWTGNGTCRPGSLTCESMSLTWGPNNVCAGSLPAAKSGSSAAATYSSGGWTGRADYTCSNRSWILNSSSCDNTGGTLPCPAGGKIWTVSGNNCVGNAPETASGSQAVVSSLIPSMPGSATYACTNGTWASTPTSATCASSSCASQAVTWGTGGKCSGTLTAAGNGAQIVQDATAPTTGIASYTCSNGTWSGPSSSSCVSSCTGGTKSWTGAGGVQCTGTLGNLSSGSSQQVSPTNGKIGQITFTCNDGVLTPSGQTCSEQQGCAAGTKTWTVGSTTCQGPIALTNSGSSASATSNNGYTGTATYSCSNGTWSSTPTNATCTQTCTKKVTTNTTVTVPAGISSVTYSIKGGGGGGNGRSPSAGGSGGAPGGGGGSTALYKNGSFLNYAAGGAGGRNMDACGDGGGTTSGTVTVSQGNTFSTVIGGGGGGGGNGSSGYSEMYSCSGGGGGGAGYGGGAGGAGCRSETNASGGGAGGSAGSGGNCTSGMYGGSGITCGGGGRGGGPGSGTSGGIGGSPGWSYHGGGGGGGGQGQYGGNGGTGPSGGGAGGTGGRICGGSTTDNGGETTGYGGGPGWVTFTYQSSQCNL